MDRLFVSNLLHTCLLTNCKKIHSPNEIKTLQATWKIIHTDVIPDLLRKEKKKNRLNLWEGSIILAYFVFIIFILRLVQRNDMRHEMTRITVFCTFISCSSWSSSYHVFSRLMYEFTTCLIFSDEIFNILVQLWLLFVTWNLVVVDLQKKFILLCTVEVQQDKWCMLVQYRWWWWHTNYFYNKVIKLFNDQREVA